MGIVTLGGSGGGGGSGTDPADKVRITALETSQGMQNTALLTMAGAAAVATSQAAQDRRIS